MNVAENDQTDQMHHSMDTEEQGNTLRLFAGETYKSFTMRD